MGLLKEFKQFALKGNVIDLAVAVVIGAAFGAVITSLVADVITPLLLAPALKAANADDLGELTWRAVKYGRFLAAILMFIVIAFVLFLIVRGINRMKKEPPATPAVPSTTDQLLMEIRDALKK